MIQDQIFREGEGDNWFQRNREALQTGEPMEEDPVIRILRLTGITSASVLEIGASNGYRLEHIRTSFNCKVTGVEPSRQAISDGQTRNPAITLLEGVASDLPLDDKFVVDLVIVNYVLHWVDRSTLLRSIAEIDRVLADNGYLVIGEFYPTTPQRVKYHHLPGQNVFTYKQSYIDIFLASNLYELVTFLTLDHATGKINPQVPGPDRGCVALLKKKLQGRYAVMSDSDTKDSSES